MGYIGTKPANAPLTSSQLEDGLVTAAKLATDAVETAKVKDINITTAKITDLNVTAGKLATDAVETAKVKDLNVTAGKLAATQDLSTKTITLPATVSGLGTGITNSQLAGSIDVTSKITGTIPTANLGSGSASSSTYLSGDQSYKPLSEYDDDAVVNDIATLALHQATNANAAKYNLVNTNVDQYEDSTGVASFTDCERNTAGEWIGSVSTLTSYDSSLQTICANMTIFTGSWTNSTTNDSFSSPAGVGGDYPGFYVNYIYDLAGDWQIRIFNVTRATGNNDITEDYTVWNTLITSDTSVASGADTASAVADGRVFRQTDFSAACSGIYRMDTGTEWGDNYLIASYASTIGVDSATAHNVGPGSGHQQIDCSGLTTPFINSFYTSSTQNSYGWLVEYDRDAATITQRNATNTAWTTFAADKTTWTNVPAAGRLLMCPGSGNGQQSRTMYYSTTYNGVLDEDKGYILTPTASATGNYVSTATTANASVTSMGAVILYKNNEGTNALNTDIVLEVSANGGSNYTTAVLEAGGTFSTGVLQAIANDIVVTAGTSVQYRISFANQSLGSKEAQIHGVSLMY